MKAKCGDRISAVTDYTPAGKDITITGKGQITGKATKDMVLKGKKILQN